MLIFHGVEIAFVDRRVKLYIWLNFTSLTLNSNGYWRVGEKCSKKYVILTRSPITPAGNVMFYKETQSSNIIIIYMDCNNKMSIIFYMPYV